MHRFFPAAPCLLLLFAACEVSSGGRGIGFADFPDRTEQAPVGVHFARLYLPDGTPNEANRYVELTHDGNQALDLSGQDGALALVSAAGSVQLPAVVWQPNTLLKVTGESLRPLVLHRHLGELAVVDSQGSVQAYSAWGGDGLLLTGGLGELAQESGFATAGTGPLAFPLRDDQAVWLSPNATAPCTASEPNLVPPFVGAACAARAGASGPWVSRVVPADVADAGASLELYNPDPNAWLDPYGLLLCTASAGCAPLTYHDPANVGVVALAPAATGGIAADPVQTAARRRLVLRGARPRDGNDWLSQLAPVQRGDEVALLPPAATSTATGTDSNALFYLRLGASRATALAASSALLATVADANVRAAWQAEAAPAPRLDEEAAVLLVDAAGGPASPAAWSLAVDPVGAELGYQAAPYAACSLPQAPAAAVLQWLRVAQLSTTEARLSLRNASGDPVVLADLELLLGDANVLLANLQPGPTAASQTSISPGAQLTLGVTPNAACTAGADLCWSAAPTTLDAGELTVQRAGVPLAYVQWGTANAANASRGTLAAEAGVWPGPSCRVSDFAGDDLHTSLRLIANQPGQSPADYAAGP